MIDSKILASIIIVACIGVAAAGYQMTQTEAPLWDPSSTQDVQTDDSSQSPDDTQEDTQEDTQTNLDTQNSGSDTKSGTSDSGKSKQTTSNSNSKNSNGNGNSGSNSASNSGSGSGSNSGTNTNNNGGTNTQKKSNSDSGGISYSQAKSIANKNIEADGAHAGSPKKTTLSGESVYYVPVINENGKVVGEFYINMKGKVVEASGGA